MRYIALVEPFSDGHRLSFSAQFVKALLGLGYKVLVCFPKPDQLRSYLENMDVNIDSVWFVTYRFKRKRRVNTSIAFEVWECLNEWRNVSSLINHAESRFKIDVQFVFFCWLDSYFQNYVPGKLIQFVFKRKWSGLYFHPKHLYQLNNLKDRPGISEIDSLLMDRRCSGIAIHDGGMVNTYRQRIGKTVALFPETADLTMPNRSNTLVNEIKNRSRGRHIVGLIGLNPYKGLATLVKVAQKADDNRFFFVIVGELPKEKYSDNDLSLIESYFTSNQENSFVFLNSLEEGEEFNSVFNCFDTPFLVYKNFYSSSNNLTKAAYMKKKVIASKGYCVGRDVDKYQLGLTVNQDDVDGCIQALNTLSREKGLTSNEKELFLEYSSLQSEKNLPDRFKDLIR